MFGCYHRLHGTLLELNANSTACSCCLLKVETTDWHFWQLFHVNRNSQCQEVNSKANDISCSTPIRNLWRQTARLYWTQRTGWQLTRPCRCSGLPSMDGCGNICVRAKHHPSGCILPLQWLGNQIYFTIAIPGPCNPRNFPNHKKCWLPHELSFL